MARIARVVVPGAAHHVTQRGNRRQQTFFSDDDYTEYLSLMRRYSEKCGVSIWAYCLMPNHVHLIAVPDREDSLARAIGEAHRRYTRMINFREGWRGYLWQGRFASYVMDEAYLLACARYVELNPVRAGLVERPEEWRWSSAAAHMEGKDDVLVAVGPLLDKARYDWHDFLTLPVATSEAGLIRKHERTGRPLGSKEFVVGLEARLDRQLSPHKPGPKNERGQDER